MKFQLALFFSLLFFISGSLSLKAFPHTSGPTLEIEFKNEKQRLKFEQRKEKFKKKADKIKNRLKKKGISLNEEGDPFSDSKFVYGALFLGGALALSIVSVLGILSGFLGFLAGLFALAGLVLIIWSLIENS